MKFILYIYCLLTRRHIKTKGSVVRGNKVYSFVCANCDRPMGTPWTTPTRNHGDTEEVHLRYTFLRTTDIVNANHRQFDRNNLPVYLNPPPPPPIKKKEIKAII